MTGEQSNGRSDRRRGVAASRAKLNQALAASSLPKKTQAALAERIADIEGLDAAPKDLVSRVFRGVPVDAQSLERVARALNVPADSLFDTSSSPPSSSESTTNSAALQQRLGVAFNAIGPGRLGVVAAVALAALAGVGLALRPVSRCVIGETFASAKVTNGKLGVLIAGFDRDESNRAQEIIASAFAADSRLAPEVEIIRTCRKLSPPDGGNLSMGRQRLRLEAQRLMRNARADILIWGEVREGEANARIVSTRKAPIAATELGERIVQVDEMEIMAPVSLAKPYAGLPDLKRLAIDMMAPTDEGGTERRARVLATLETATDWLDASIVADRNFLRSLGKNQRASHWGAINAQLCYKYRLRGEAKMEKSDFLEADLHCRDALSQISKEHAPTEWATVMTNRSAIPMRLALFAGDVEERLRLVSEAQSILADALAALPETGAAMQRANIERYLAGVLVYRTELEMDRGDKEAADANFARAHELTEAALRYIDESSNPQAFGHLHQNICVGLYRRAMRTGGEAAIPDLDEAIRRCTTARDALPINESPLDWGMIQNNLAVSNAIKATFANKPAALEAAITEFERAKEAYRHDLYPAKWAEVEVNLGELHCNLARLKKDAAPIDPGLAHAEGALAEFMRFGVDAYANYARAVIANLQTCRADIAACNCSE